jgi:hypothetical protein
MMVYGAVEIARSGSGVQAELITMLRGFNSADISALDPTSVYKRGSGSASSEGDTMLTRMSTTTGTRGRT